MCRASGVAAVIDRSAVPVVDGALEALRDGFVSGGTRRNLEWVRPHLRTAAGVTEDDLLFLADAQTSGVCSSSASCPVIRSSGTPWPVVESRCDDASFPKRAGDAHISATIDLDRSAAIPIGERFHVR